MADIIISVVVLLFVVSIVLILLDKIIRDYCKKIENKFNQEKEMMAEWASSHGITFKYLRRNSIYEHLWSVEYEENKVIYTSYKLYMVLDKLRKLHRYGASDGFVKFVKYREKIFNGKKSPKNKWKY